MTNPNNKQHILYFVLAVSGILLLLLVLHLADLPKKFMVLSILSSLLLISIYGLIQVKHTLKRYNRMRDALAVLEEGQSLREGGARERNSADPILQSLVKISNRIESQKQELKSERLIRIRSVIDGQDLERQRLSRELHDGLGQSLIAVKLKLENAGDQGYSQMRASVDIAKEMLDQTIDEVRRVTNALIPAALNEFGLITALRVRCEEMASSAGLKVHFETIGSVERLENKSKTYLYRIAQEAISNIIKHARATEFSIKVERQEQEVALLVTDNGKGFIFDPALFAHRNGLQNIRERVALLNGAFELISQPNAGTTLKVVIPYKPGDGKNPNYSS